ncbi:MAG: 4a-hydroxytetrahydrobiopterin dehydratase, partial [Nanoarchaeota archaeon]|nr:4a-hydroxytetrahydrobiopterin dehydratase [Nanoarchaeota archaeon]
MLTLQEINEAMEDLENWALEMNALSKVFSFGHFRESLEFVNKVGEAAEKLSHYPEVLIDFDSVRLL